MTDVAAEPERAAPPLRRASPAAVPAPDSPPSAPTKPDLAALEPRVPVADASPSPSPPADGRAEKAVREEGDDVGDGTQREAELRPEEPCGEHASSQPHSPSSGDHLENGVTERDEQPTSVEREDADVKRNGAACDSVEPDDKPSSLLDKPASDSSFDDPFAELDVVSTMDLFDVSNYTFGIKNEQCRCKLMLSSSKTELYDHLRTTYNKRGIRRSVGAVILVHNHRFPHILLLQRKDGRGEYVLPGGRLRPGESNEDGLQRKLVSKLTPSPTAEPDDDDTARPDVGEKLCSWYAIDFDRRYFPYVPAHVTKPKEELHIYAVSLPSKFTFAVPNNLQLLAVPIFDIFNNSATYGDVISSIPSVLSKYHFNYC